MWWFFRSAQKINILTHSPYISNTHPTQGNFGGNFEHIILIWKTNWMTAQMVGLLINLEFSSFSLFQSGVKLMNFISKWHKNKPNVQNLSTNPHKFHRLRNSPIFVPDISKLWIKRAKFTPKFPSVCTSIPPLPLNSNDRYDTVKMCLKQKEY